MAIQTDYDDLDLTLLDVSELRDVYRFYKRAALYGLSEKDLEGYLAQFEGLTPIEWVKTLKAIRSGCEKCSGTGVYKWGASINGRMTRSGRCFRCEGKGYQTLADMRRNRGHDNHAIQRGFA